MDIHIVAPEAGKDYPRNWNEFLDWFGSEEACLSYLERLRWPQGFVCPSCGVVQPAYRSSRLRLMCRSCGHQSSVTAGTIFDKTRTALRVWLAAAWYLTNQKQGVSALGLQRVLGLGSYATAWTMLHRFRRAMVRPDRDRLKGVVEVDETYLAITDRDAPTSAARRKSRTSKVLVAVAVEMLQPKGFGRIRLCRIDNDSDECVVPFVHASVEPGAQVHDGSAAYRSLSKLGYDHQRAACSARKSRHTSRWPGCIASLRSSSVGSWARTVARSNPSILTPTWTSSCFASIGAPRPRAACCSIACCSRPSSPIR